MADSRDSRDSRASSQGPRELKGRIVVYSIIGCPHCLKAKSTLQELRLPYTDVSVDRFPSHVGDWLRERTGRTSVPQIFFNARHVGGNEELQTLIKDDEAFQEVLRDVYENDPPTSDDASSFGGPLLPNPGEAIDIPSIDGEAFHCEPDEYAALIEEMRRAGVVKSHRKGGFPCFGKEIKDSFTGKEFVDWAVEKKMISREKAVFMGKQLVSRRFGVNVDEEQEFRDDARAIYKLGTSDADRVLNASEVAECVQRPASEVAGDLRKLILKLFAEHLSPDGKTVDYKGIAESKSFESYKKMTNELQRVDLEKVSQKDRLAFFINTYNALVIHGTVERGTPSNLWQRFKFFSTVSYSIGGLVYSLNDMENGVLRANRGSMATLYLTPFASKSDARLKIALAEPEPRIHFALNCGAKSCPPIKTFSGRGIDKQLNLATASYLESDDALRVDLESQTVHLSMLFKWYHNDFGRNKAEILKWILDKLTDDKKKKELAELLETEQYKVKYIPYDWGNNKKED